MTPTIFLDLDGTLLDSEWLSQASYQVGARAALGRNLTASEAQYLLGKPFRALGDLFSAEEAAAVIRAMFAFYEEEHHRIGPYPGVAVALAELRRAGHRLGLVTTKLRRYALAELGQTGLLEFFSAAVCQEDCPEVKPSPAPLLMATRVLDVPPASCWYVGDQPTDLVAAHRAGMVAVAALWGEGHQRRLAQAAPDQWVPEPRDLLALAARSPELQAQRRQQGAGIFRAHDPAGIGAAREGDGHPTAGVVVHDGKRAARAGDKRAHGEDPREL